MNFSIKLCLSIALLLSYYHYTKIWLRKPAYHIARFFNLTKKYDLQVAKGAVGFLLVVLTHVAFAVLLIFLCRIPYPLLGFKYIEFNQMCLSVLLGAGMAGSSMLVALLIMKLLIKFKGNTQQEIMLALGGGWLKSYHYARMILPINYYLLVIILQLSCEEVIFRSVFINYFLNFGNLFAVTVSTGLFTIMQIFLMPTLRGAIFPVVGALMIGIVHGYLFLATHSIWPLILSHSAFFMLFML